MDLRIPIDHVKYGGQYGHAEFMMLRLDQMNTPVADNKFFKLRWLMEHPSLNSETSLVSCGGPYSNHLVALSKMAVYLGCKSIGYVRGSHFGTNPVLELCKSNGMKIVLVASSDFDPDQLASLAAQSHPGGVWIPMGGSSNEGMEGAHLLSEFIPNDILEVHMPVGTGGTIAGLASVWKNKVMGYEVVLEGSWADSEDVRGMVENLSNIQWFRDKRWGRFGKVGKELLAFAREWFEKTGIPLDMNYNARMIQSIVYQGIIDSRVLVINTGGLTGNLGHEALLGQDIYPSFSKHSC